MSHDPYRPETAIDLALERPFPMEDSVNYPTTKRCPTCDAHSCSCAKEDAEIEHILSMPDDELLAEAVANGEDVHALAEESSALFAAIAGSDESTNKLPRRHPMDDVTDAAVEALTNESIVKWRSADNQGDLVRFAIRHVLTSRQPKRVDADQIAKTGMSWDELVRAYHRLKSDSAARIAELEAEVAGWRVDQRSLSNAYIRLRCKIPGALNAPPEPTGEVVLATTEAALDRLVAAAQSPTIRLVEGLTEAQEVVASELRPPAKHAHKPQHWVKVPMGRVGNHGGDRCVADWGECGVWSVHGWKPMTATEAFADGYRYLEPFDPQEGWEQIYRCNDTDETDRLKVPGGWLYRNISSVWYGAETGTQKTMTFVPAAALRAGATPKPEPVDWLARAQRQLERGDTVYGTDAIMAGLCEQIADLKAKVV